jgi:hypothetical protein
MATFLDQPGVPVVSALLVDDGKSVRLAQQRFVLAGVQAPPRAMADPGRREVLGRRRRADEDVPAHLGLQDFKLGDRHRRVDWIHPNAGERGYYRWSVGPALSDHDGGGGGAPPRHARAHRLRGQPLRAARRGAAPRRRLPALLASFAADPDPLVVSAVVTALDEARTALITPETRGAFATYVQRTLGADARAHRSGSPAGGAGVRGRAAPTLLWWLGVYGNDPRIQAYARELVTRISPIPRRVDPGLSGAALEIAPPPPAIAPSSTGSASASSDDVPVERTRLFTALGRFAIRR